MSLTEETRYQLYQGLRETLGTERATTLMDLLPPVGWADVATKRDLDSLGNSLRREMATMGAEVRGEIQATRAEFFREQRNQTIAIIGANATIMGILLAAFRFL